ncbi:MAG: nucleotidyltransferase domain-containing protein [Nanoarchaeota archaeon]|nr:nucleotidyltransferase domain-containing protein [Nanoarchaeota archaeon]
MSFPKSEYKLLKLIYENPGIRLSELIKKAKVSVKVAKERLDYLLSYEIIKEDKILGGKRVILKSFFPNFLSEEGKNVFSLVELDKRKEFLEKNKGLKGPIKQLLKNIDKKIKIIIIFGSFANYSQTKDSDLDILFLSKGEVDRELLKKEIERSFVTFNYEVSARIDSLDNFKKNIDKGIYQSIIKNHVIIKGALDFIGLAQGF